ILTRLRCSWHLAFTGTPVLALGWFGQSSSQEPATIKELSDEELAIIQSDKLFDDNSIDKLYELLMKWHGSKNAEVVWRLARAARNKAELSKSIEDKKSFTYQAYEYAKKSVELDGQNFACHKWLGITLSNVGDFEGNKVKIQNAYKIKDHFQKAIELNPTDPTCRYLLGVWCFTFADMPWYQQTLAAAIFATPPESSYQEVSLAFKDPISYPIMPCTYDLLLKTLHLIILKEQRLAKKEAEDLLKTL
ncbi:hypothetical protein QZH41_013147, partial [Actinostola sp. cb2023]